MWLFVLVFTTVSAAAGLILLVWGIKNVMSPSHGGYFGDMDTSLGYAQLFLSLVACVVFLWGLWALGLRFSVTVGG